MADTKQNIKVDIPEDQKLGRYVNLAFVNHDQEMFTLDLLYLQNGPIPVEGKQATLLGRMHMTPALAKRLVQALAHNIETYEKAHGVIDPAPAPAVGTTN